MKYEIKRAPQDFIVEEITPDGKVLQTGKKHVFDLKSQGDQLVCVLEKTNWDAHLAMKKIAERLHVSPTRFGFTGTKDKRAVTTQRISIWQVKPNVAELKIKDITLKPLYYSNQRVELGDLQGNRFTIRVFSRKKPGKQPKKLLVPNRFGEQRFGTTRPITHLVGKAIVQDDFEQAVKIYLTKVFPAENKEAKTARRKLARSWKTRAWHDALEYFPKNLKFERTLLGHLELDPSDFVGAVRRLPKFLQLMFVHAYQSWLYNQILEEVVKKKLGYETGALFGTQTQPKNPVEDKVFKKEKLEPADFFIKQAPELSSKGERRALWINITDFKILEQGKGYAIMRFSLPKGCYATSVIDFLFKTKKR